MNGRLTASVEVSGAVVAIEGKRLLAGVDLSCAGGTLTALVGPNGAGKSTLLGLVAGDRRPDAGTVRLNGRAIEAHSIRELAQIRSVFPQNALLRFSYSVEEVVRMGRTFRDLPPGEDDRSVEAAMRDTEIAHLAGRDATTLSGGELARTTFARVLAQETPIVLLDEPTAALDLRHQERVLRTARDLAMGGACVIAVLHDLNLAAAYADQVVLLSEGRGTAAGSPWEVLRQELVAEVYRQDVCVIRHPNRDCPVVITT